MCEEVLSDALEGKIHPQALLSWITNHKSEQNILEKSNYKCSQGDFILYFLNYIHDIQARVSGSSTEAAQKSTKQPSSFDTGEDSFDENSLTCSPVVVKCNADESYASPISPLYSRQNLITPRHRQAHSTPKITATLCLGDFIVTRGKQSAKKKVQRSLNENAFAHCEDYSSSARRITPVSVTSASLYQKSTNSFNFENGVEEINGHQAPVTEDRIRILSRNTPADSCTFPKTVVNRKKEIMPSMKFVTFKAKLDLLVLIYNFMFDHNFVLNVTSELHFLISVLLSKECEQCDEVNLNNSYGFGIEPIDGTTENVSLLGTIHNRVYFASKVLECQLSTLRMFDWSTLRLLLENKRLWQFCSSSFMCRLSDMDNSSVEKPVAEISELPQSTVCFISDTDNRDNFPNDSSFHAFRKQRDLFYEVLRVWENSRLQDNWSFPVALGGKIKALLGMHSDPANLVHLARLFKAQLLMSACGKSEEDSLLGESQLSLLASIPNVDAEKLLRLKNRIVSKESDSGINSRPSFTSYQEFYHDFILVAASHVFNKHLNDALISEIVELNNTKFSCLDFDDTGDADSTHFFKDGATDASTRSSYTFCIKSLRVLAKFLGFLDSLPYRNDQVQMPQNVVGCQLGIRNETQPSFNLKAILQGSIQNKSLILAVPWVVTYLAMLDFVTIRLPYFEEILHTLFEVYYANGKAVKLASNLNYKQNVFLVRLCLGWLFELPHFPEGMYFTWLSGRLDTNELALKAHKSGAKRACLDELNIVDHSVLSACCPYLIEIKRMLSNNLSTSNGSSVTIKHITPTMAAESPTDVLNKRVQLQLEEAFFNGQPVSVRKTVDFISERIASACVKHICGEIVPANKKETVVKLKEVLESHNVADIDDENELARMRLLVNTKSSTFAGSALKELRTQIDAEVESMIKARIPAAIEALFALDILKQTKDVCATIASRLCKERVQQWVNSHVNTGIYKKDFDAEIKQAFARHSLKNAKLKPVFALPMFGRDVSHNPAALSGVEIIENIRGCSWRLLEDTNSVTVQTVLGLLDMVYQSIEERCDVNDCVLAQVNKMLVDLSLLLIAHRPEIFMDSAVFMRLSSIWRKATHGNTDDLFRTLVCPRNIMLLSQSSNERLSWSCLKQFVANLAEERLLGDDLLQHHIDVLGHESFGDFAQANCGS